MLLSCQKSVHNSALFENLIPSVIDFEGEYTCYFLHLASNLYAVNQKF